MSAKRRCVGFVLAEAFDNFGEGEDSVVVVFRGRGTFRRVLMTCLIVSLCLRCLL